MNLNAPVSLNSIRNSTVLVRVGFDIPDLDSPGRILAALPTIQCLLDNHNKILLLTKWGDDKESGFYIQRSVSRIIGLVRQAWNLPVTFLNHIDYLQRTIEFKELVNNSNANLMLLENAHFWPAEKSKNASERNQVAQFYSSIADYYVDECFISSHRIEATNTEIKKELPWALGLDYINEVNHLNKFRSDPDRPFVVVMGGAKMSTKLPLLEQMLHKADKVLVAGLLCFTFLEASNQLGYTNCDIKNSYVETQFLERARSILRTHADKIILPSDFVWDDDKACDIGQKSVAIFEQNLETSKSVFWNGPLGNYEKIEYRQATLQLGRFLASLKSSYRVIGGGDTDASLPDDILNELDFVSKGGGATLSFLTSS